MLQLIKRCPEFVAGYREYCRELYENDVVYFRPTKPDSIDDDWFCRTKPLYDRKERESTNGRSPSFHYWAVDADEFIGEFQLRTQFTEHVMTEIKTVVAL